MAKVDPRQAAFLGDVLELFVFLVEEFGFTGPEDVGDDWFEYSAVPWSVSIGLDFEHDQRVVTSVTFDDGVTVKTLLVWCVVARAKLRGVGQPAESARTRLGMRNTLAGQAKALRAVVPILQSDRGKSLMEAADG